MRRIGSSIAVVVVAVAALVRTTEAYTSPSRNFLTPGATLSQQALLHHNGIRRRRNLQSRRRRATATEEAIVDVTEATTFLNDAASENLFDWPPWLSQHVDRETTEARVKELEFALLEQGFSLMDIRDIALTMEAASKGDQVKLGGMVDFLNLLLSLSSSSEGGGASSSSSGDSFVTKEVLQASVLHFGDCVTARQTGVYDMVRDAIFGGGDATTTSTSSSSTGYRILGGPPPSSRSTSGVHEFIEVFQKDDDTSESASLVVVNNGDSPFAKRNADALDIARSASRVKRAEVLASTILGSGTTKKDGLRTSSLLKEEEASRLRGLLLSVMDDWRALGIRVVACLYRLQGLIEARNNSIRVGDEQQQQNSAVSNRAAREALRIYAPLAQRLGMQRLKAKLEDSAFQLLYKRQYRAVHSYLYNSGRAQAMKAVTRYLENEVSSKLVANEMLMDHLESFSVKSRVKEPYSAWKKLLRQRWKGKLKNNNSNKDTPTTVAVDVQSASSTMSSPVGDDVRPTTDRQRQLSLHNIHDGVALRVILKAKKLAPDEPEETTRGRERILCYVVQRMIQDDWPIMNTPNPRIKDYIQHPKPNGYQSLHYTSSIAIKDAGLSLPFEVQVRSEEMHRIAEYGVAAHWDYKLKAAPPTASSIISSSDTANTAALTVPSSETTAMQVPKALSYLDALEVAKENLVQNKVFCFFAGTSAIDGTGQLLSLSTGATVQDALDALQEQVDVPRLRDMVMTSTTDKTNNDDEDDGDELDSSKLTKNGRPTMLSEAVINGDVLLLRL